MKRFPIVLGVTMAVAVYLIRGGWWLDSGDRVRDTLIALAVVSFVLAAFFYRSDPTWHPGRDLWIGFMVGITVVLFMIGPGTIFPIVLFIGGAMSGVAVLAGYGVAAAVRTALTLRGRAFD